MSRRSLLRLAAVCLICALAPAATGCYDRVEVEDLAYILAVGFDLAPTGDIEVISQIALPANSEGGGGGGGGGGGAGGMPVSVAVATGKTAMEAFRHLAQASSKRPFWGQARVVVFGEALARRGLGPVLDILSRNYETRRLMYVMVCPGRAHDILTARPEIESMPALLLSGLEQMATFHSLAARTTLHDFLISVGAAGNEAFAARVMLEKQMDEIKSGTDRNEKTQLRIDGCGVFFQDRLVGWLDGPTTRGLLWLRGDADSSVISIDDSASGIKGSIEVTRASSEITAAIDPNDLANTRFTVRIRAVGRLTEEYCGPDVARRETVNLIDQLAANEIKAEALAAIAALQGELRSDVIGLGEKVRERLSNAAWDAVKAKWPGYFPKVKVEVNVDFKVSRHGMTLGRLTPDVQR